MLIIVENFNSGKYSDKKSFDNDNKTEHLNANYSDGNNSFQLNKSTELNKVGKQNYFTI